MGIVSAQFGSTKFDQLEGFRISVAFIPGQGFEGNFFVYLWDSIDAGKTFDEAIEYARGSEAPRGELTISDGSTFTYKFPDIDLTYAEVGATRSMRYRLVEFHYPQDRTDRQNPIEISLENRIQKKLAHGRLREDYDFKLDDSPETLLGFRARLSANEDKIIRFSALRNDSNSFLKKLWDVNKSQIGDEMRTFIVDFKQKKFQITASNLARAFVVESFGSFTDIPLPSLEDILRTREIGELTRLKPEDITAAELIRHNTREMRHLNAAGDLVETATFVLVDTNAPNDDENLRDIKIV